jgi:hypothetical protein
MAVSSVAPVAMALPQQFPTAHVNGFSDSFSLGGPQYPPLGTNSGAYTLKHAK